MAMKLTVVADSAGHQALYVRGSLNCALDQVTMQAMVASVGTRRNVILAYEEIDFVHDEWPLALGAALRPPVVEEPEPLAEEPLTETVSEPAEPPVEEPTPLEEPKLFEEPDAT